MLYGDSIELLQDTLRYYFDTYGSGAKLPERQLTSVVKDWLLDSKSPFVERGFLRDFSNRGRLLYLELTPGESCYEMLSEIQTMLKFPVRCISQAEIPRIIPENGSVAVLDISTIRGFDRYIYIRWWLKFLNRLGVPGSGNISVDRFYEVIDDKPSMLNGIVQ